MEMTIPLNVKLVIPLVWNALEIQNKTAQSVLILTIIMNLNAKRHAPSTFFTKTTLMHFVLYATHYASHAKVLHRMIAPVAIHLFISYMKVLAYLNALISYILLTLNQTKIRNLFIFY